jgi:hypothetical protein
MGENARIGVYLDPGTHHFLKDKLFDISQGGHAGDQILAPYVYLKQFLTARGIGVRTADYFPEKPDGARNVYISFGNFSMYRRLAARSDTVLSAFIAMECPTVEPSLYRELNHAQNAFKRVYSWSDSQSLKPFVGGPLRCLPMRWPQSFDCVHESVWSKTDRGFLVMLNGNKLPRYESPGHELYSERMRAIEYFSQTGEIDLYGNGWDGPTYRVGQWCVPGTFGKVPMPGTVQFLSRAMVNSWQRLVPEPRLVAARKVYKGFATSKSATLGKYKFSLCFENSVLKGWTTEKIFDCFFAGTIPVYWGAPDIADYIPRECFIDKRQFPDYAELRRYLKALPERAIRDYKENARAFVNSPAFQPFTKRAFAELFAGIVEQDTGIRLSEPGVAS